jgi:predicted protein tyrosine phosphatase
MPRPPARLFALFIAVLLVAGPLWYYFYRSAMFRNFHEVRENVLYRSGQMPLAGLKRVILDHRIRTVVTLRDARRHPELPPPDSGEQKWCQENFINYYRLPPTAWSSTDGSVPAEPMLRKFLEVMRDPDNYPVLIHCMAGINRTGAFCAVYRMEIEHWSNDAAIAEMKRLGYDNIEEHQDLYSYLERYRPTWRHAQAGSAGHEEAEAGSPTSLTTPARPVPGGSGAGPVSPSASPSASQ